MLRRGGEVGLRRRQLPALEKSPCEQAEPTRARTDQAGRGVDCSSKSLRALGDS